MLNSTNFDFTQANPDGSDIRFLGPDRVTLLNYWIQDWDPVAEQAVIWVKVPLLRGGENTTIYMLYGNPAAAFDATHYGLLKVMESLPASDGSNYVIYYEPWDMGANYFDLSQGVYQSAWSADDGYWSYTLPFTFPHYSATYSSVYVCSNGFLGTTYAGADYSSTIAELESRGMIAPFWADLMTNLAGTGIYLNDSYSDEYGQGVLIRWATKFYYNRGAQNFDVVLYSNGLIRFDYGTIYGTSSTDDTPVIGVSYSDGTHYTLLVTSDNENPSNWDNHNSVMLWPRKKATVEPSVAIYPAVRSLKQAVAISGSLAAAGAALLITGFLGLIDNVLAFTVGLPLIGVGVASLAIYKIKQGEPYRELAPKIPYLYLFMDMYLTAGLSASDALGKAAEMLDDKVLLLLHRHLVAGYGHEEAVERVFDGFKGMARTYIENLLRSSFFGTGGVSFIRDTLSHLLIEKEKEIEKVTQQLSMITEVYTVAGVFAPLTAISALAALYVFGTGGVDPSLVAVLVMLMSIAAMSAVALIAKTVIDRVRV